MFVCKRDFKFSPVLNERILRFINPISIVLKEEWLLLMYTLLIYFVSKSFLPLLWFCKKIKLVYIIDLNVLLFSFLNETIRKSSI